MIPRRLFMVATVAALAAASACTSDDAAPVEQGYGTDPLLPEPDSDLIPTVNVAKADRWKDGEKPQPAPGLTVAEFAADLDHPRWLYVLPNGDVLVAETNAPPQPEAGGGIKGFFMKRAMKKAGAAVPSADRITLLRDSDGDGRAETRSVFLSDLYSPFGMALVDDRLYVANADGVVAVPYTDGQTETDESPTEITSLPGGPLNHHWTKNIIASPDGTKLYAAVGSNSNVGENGLDKEKGRAAIWEIDLETGEKRLYATGLRNPVGMDFDERTGRLYAAVNERDELGPNLVPDYLTSVREGGFYGWPYSYFGDHVDGRIEPQKPEMVAQAIVPDYALGSHTASLGLVIDETGDALAGRFGSGAYVGQHGSWNRKPRSGYKVVFIPFENGRPAGRPVDILTGFLEGDVARGRPVGVAIDPGGALLIADDVGNRVWRVTAGGERAE